jgi:hypothetical protein
MAAYEKWCEHACALEAKRVERDLGALQQECEAVANAKHWSEFNCASPAVVRDYLKATGSRWQEGMGIAIRNQSAFAEAFFDAMKYWQSTWTGEIQKVGATNRGTLPPWPKSSAMPTELAQPATARGDGSGTHAAIQSGTGSRGAETTLQRRHRGRCNPGGPGLARRAFIG